MDSAHTDDRAALVSRTRTAKIGDMAVNGTNNMAKYLAGIHVLSQVLQTQKQMATQLIASATASTPTAGDSASFSSEALALLDAALATSAVDTATPASQDAAQAAVSA